MKADKWNALNEAQQEEHLSRGAWKMESAGFVRANAIVGDMKDGDSGTGYRFLKNGIILSDYHLSPGEAWSEAKENLSAFLGMLENDT